MYISVISMHTYKYVSKLTYVYTYVLFLLHPFKIVGRESTSLVDQSMCTDARQYLLWSDGTKVLVSQARYLLIC